MACPLLRTGGHKKYSYKSKLITVTKKAMKAENKTVCASVKSS